MGTSYLQEFNMGSVLLRLLLAMASGAAIGFGRARKKQNAGFRTYILVSLGSALTILISLYEYEMLTHAWAYAAEYTDIKFDASRLATQVVNGIGFLTAGTIIAIAHRQVSGLTTAIGLFAAACLGIATGTKMCSISSCVPARISASPFCSCGSRAAPTAKPRPTRPSSCCAPGGKSTASCCSPTSRRCPASSRSTTAARVRKLYNCSVPMRLKLRLIAR